MVEEIYDVVVLGGGAGGVPAAIRAAQLGGRVGIIEDRDLGGQCMNRGCIPFGQMMVASNVLKGLSLAQGMGIRFNGGSKDYGALIKRQDSLINFMRLGIKTTLKKHKIDIIEGKGKITGKGMVAVNGEIISYKNIILAAGSKWVKPTFSGADLEEVVFPDFLLTADHLPKDVLLFGQSPWLAEIAQFLTRYGSRVMLVTHEERLFSAESKSISTRLKKVLLDEGIEVRTQAEIEDVTRKRDGLRVELKSKEGSEEVFVDKVITFERAAVLKDLGLSNIGIDESRDYLIVNDKMKTGIEGVFAIGDLTAPPSQHYSHLASEGGIVAAENAMGGNSALNSKIRARILFTQPQLASVGLTPREAKNEGYDTLVGAAPLSMNPFGMIIAENEGLVEVVAEKSNGEVLGVHIIGTAAAEMIGQAVIAIRMKATVEELSATAFPHPTLSEWLSEAARDALGRPIFIP